MVTPQRNAVVARPAIFIVSSAEGLPVAQCFQKDLAEHLTPTLWTEPGIFEPTRITFESLEAAMDRFSYALIILSADDITRSRGRQKKSARDNVIFEFGLFAGRYGRNGVFFAVPEAPGLKVPSDIFGLAPVKYREVDGAIDVAAASRAIIRSLERRHLPTRRTRSSPFWDVLSDTIIILYGVEPEIGVQPHPRHRISLRDLETAWDLKSFLDRRYPHKRISTVPVPDAGWRRRLQPEADLVVVGGFVTNQQFARNRARYERFFRLKMGRLCFVDGQRVHVPKFAPPAGCLAPDGTDPQCVEDFPTELTTRDFGFVFNGLLDIYGRHRRVVVIGGVKGNGTRGAARYLCADRDGIDAQLQTSLGENDTLELAVSVDVDGDMIDQAAPLSIRLNDELLLDAPSPSSRPCELGRPCEGCDFGVTPAAPRYADLPAKALKARVRAIVFDLDDTLIDTFNSLIVPVEVEAARAMIAAGAREKDPTTLASSLLRLRRSNPGDFENELRRSGHGITRKVLAARSRLLTSVPMENLLLSPEVMQLLRKMRNEFELYLVTAGAVDFQNRKIDKLEIRKHFMEVIIVADSSPAAKARAIETLARKRDFAKENVLIVGNRLDNEIAAGNSLGMPTVWVRHGEGSDLTPARGCGQPDFVLRHVLELASLLWP